MLLDRKKYSEFGYIGEELFSDSEDDRLHKCMVAEQTVADGDFSLNEALEAYQLTKAEYEDYIAQKFNNNIFISLSGSVDRNTKNTAISAMPGYIEVFAKMLEFSANGQGLKKFHNRIGKITRELHGLSKDINELNEKA